MSDADARRASKNAQFITEKAVLTDFLQMYRSFPCLWDQKHALYVNREERQKAYEVLLEKYKLIQDDAVVHDVKKRIEYMRCAYRREHKKVIMARMRGEEEYKPGLWYYSLLAFLNDNSGLKLTDEQYDECYQIQETHEIEDSDEEPETKKIKTDPSNVIYMSQLHDDMSVHDMCEQGYDAPADSDEPEAFGRTVGFQLREVTHEQRIYAEKLISDVIFQARLGKLNAGTTVYLSED